MLEDCFSQSFIDIAKKFVDKHDGSISLIYHDDTQIVEFVNQMYKIILYDGETLRSSKYFSIMILDTETNKPICNYNYIRAVSIMDDGYLKLYNDDIVLVSKIGLIPNHNSEIIFEEFEKIKNLISKRGENG